MTQVKLQRSFLAKVLKLFFLLQNICECWKTNGGRYQMCEGKTFEGSFQRVIWWWLWKVIEHSSDTVSSHIYHKSQITMWYYHWDDITKKSQCDIITVMISRSQILVELGATDGYMCTKIYHILLVFAKNNRFSVLIFLISLNIHFDIFDIRISKLIFFILEYLFWYLWDEDAKSK